VPCTVVSLSSLLFFVVAPHFALVLGYVVVFLLVPMLVPRPCIKVVMVLVRFSKINWTKKALPRFSLKTSRRCGYATVY
jgi:hypothetical protein